MSDIKSLPVNAVRQLHQNTNDIYSVIRMKYINEPSQHISETGEVDSMSPPLFWGIKNEKQPIGGRWVTKAEDRLAVKLL